MRANTNQVMGWCVLVALAIASTACNKSDDGQENQAAKRGDGSAVQQASHSATLGTSEQLSQANFDGPNSSEPKTHAPPATTPAEAVTNFLEAVRRGDDGQAESLLSVLAREKTREMDLAVAPPGSPTAQFEVGATEFPYDGAESAHVASKWSDVDGAGYEHTDEIVWILRKEKDHWRIAGMATKLFEDQPPLILNFEDPQDMIQKQKAAEAEIRRRRSASDSTTRRSPPAD